MGSWLSVLLLASADGKPSREHGRSFPGDVQISQNLLCVPNPPLPAGTTGPRCHYTPEVTLWLYEIAFEKLQLDELPPKRRKRLRRAMEETPCIGRGGDFPPLRRRAGYQYDVCTFQMRQFEDGKPFSVFLPSDDQDKIAECDVMPWLIRFALDDSEGHGLAIDVGAGDSGSCTWPLLSEGHVVHMFETGYVNQLERDFIELTRDVNGWQERATLHGPVQDDLYMAELLKSAEKIHLLKIDVDDRPSYEAVFAGVAPVLNKTEILQIEMIEEEIGRDGMLWIMETFHSFGFDFYGLEDLETFPRYQHDSLGRACEHGDVEGRHHSAAVEDGTMPYEYGADGPKHLRMFPICQCGAKVVGGGRGNKDPLKCRAQFAFVRRAGHVARPRVQERFGSCQTLCGAAEEL